MTRGLEAGSQEPEITVADNWREAIRLCVASCNDDDVDAALLAILTPRQGEDNRINGRSRAVLAALCLADDPNASQNVVYAVLEEFVKHINKKDGLGVVKTTVDIATKELAASRWATALFTLLLKKFVEQDSELQNSFGTLCAMAGLRKVPEGKEAIRQWLNEKATEINSGDELVATGAALQVMFHAFKGTHYRVPALVSGLFSLLNRSPFVAQAAAWALYWINTDKTTGKPWQPTSLEIERMVEYLKSQTSDSLVVRRLIYILGRERAVQSVEAMIARLDDSVEKVRIAAAESLGWMCDPRAIDPLIERLNDNGEVQREAIWSLAQLADTRCLDAVIPKLADPDPKTRETAAWALGVIGDDRGVDSLLRKLEDSDVTVRRAAIMALSRIGDVQTVPPVVRKLEAENEDERATAATALSRFGDVQVIDHLIAKLPDPSSKARSKIVIALHRFKDPKVLTALISCLEDEDAEVQKSAADVLGWLKASLAVEPLIAKMRGNPEVRKACIHALGMIRDVRAVEPLIELIDDENSDVRGLVIEALTQIGDVKATTHLIPKLEDDVVNVRSAAARGLGHLGHTESVERLCAKIEDGDVEDRELATLALYGLAMKKFESTDVEGAAEIFKMIISNTTEDEYRDNFYNDAAYCFILLKRYEEAAEQFEAMEFAKRDAAWPLYRHNLGLLSYLMGDVDKAHRYLDESLRWIQATTSYNSRDVFCMLLLEPDGRVSSRKDLPVDAGVLINLNRMGGLSQERLHKELERRYRTEYKEWIA